MAEAPEPQQRCLISKDKRLEEDGRQNPLISHRRKTNLERSLYLERERERARERERERERQREREREIKTCRNDGRGFEVAKHQEILSLRYGRNDMKAGGKERMRVRGQVTKT